MARKTLGWTIAQLAVESGMHQNTIGRFENGQHGHDNTVFRLEQALTKAGMQFIADGQWAGILWSTDKEP